MHKKNTIRISFILLFLILIIGVWIYRGTNEDVLSNARYIFIDGGAHSGETIRAFEKSNLYSQHPWEIFSFEPNPYLIPKIPKRPNVTVLSKAMWIHDKGLDFYFGLMDTGGNVVRHRATNKALHPIRVDSVDFGRWLKKNFKREDIIFVKMDIEGAEYQVLDKMLEDGSVAYVDKFYVEFHSSIMDDVSETKDQELVEAIERLGIPLVIRTIYDASGQYFNE